MQQYFDFFESATVQEESADSLNTAARDRAIAVMAAILLAVVSCPATGACPPADEETTDDGQ